MDIIYSEKIKEGIKLVVDGILIIGVKENELVDTQVG